MSEQQQKLGGGKEPAVGENNSAVDAGDTQHTTSANLDHGTTNDLGAPPDMKQGAAKDSGHGTRDRANILNCRALVPFVTGVVRSGVPVVITTGPPIAAPQQAIIEHVDDYQTGDNDGSQQYHTPRPQAPNNAYGSSVKYACVTDDDFKALNHALFNYHSPRGQIMDGSRIITAIVGGKTVLIHARVLIGSRVLYEIFNNGSEAAVMNRGVFPEIGLPEFKILMLAMYGIQSPILGHQEYAGVDYIKALSLANMFRCHARVYDAITECAQGHFNSLKNWGAIPTNALTQALHRKQLMDINDAHNAYKALIRHGGRAIFTENAFAILLWEFCPAPVYCMYSDVLDNELIRLVSCAALRQRENTRPFTAQETKLFTHPGH